MFRPQPQPHTSTAHQPSSPHPNTYDVPFATTAHVDPDTGDLVVIYAARQHRATLMLNEHGKPVLYNDATKTTLELGHPACHDARAAVLRAAARL